MVEKTLRAGILVEIDGLRGQFEILEGPNSKDEYLIAHGHIRVWVSHSRIKEVPPPTKKHKRAYKPKLTVHREEAPGQSLKIDLHGMSVTEAVEAMEKLLDRAVLQNAPSVEIVHGIGTGAIKQAVHAILARYPHLSSYRVDPSNPGTTWAYL